MKDYRTIISSDTVENICKALDDCLVDTFEGCMLDNYFFSVGNNDMRLGQSQTKKVRYDLRKGLE